MAVSVYLNFTRPIEPDIARMRIYEAPVKAGPFNVIEEVTAVGTYPNYISDYTTNAAVSVADWFAIQWVNLKGAESDLSAPIQGNTTSLIGEIVQRVLLRDSSLDEVIATQEAEAVVAEYFNVVDPYSVLPTVSPKILRGLTNMTLVRTYLSSIITSTGAGSGEKWSAGIVSMDTSVSSTKQLNDMQALLKMANDDLGLNQSIVLLIKEIEVAGGYKRLQGVDLTRSIYELG
jgi:hypothetical protein